MFSGGWDSNDFRDGLFSLEFGIDLSSTASTTLFAPSPSTIATPTTSQSPGQGSAFSAEEHNTWESTSSSHQRSSGLPAPETSSPSTTSWEAHVTTAASGRVITAATSELISMFSAGAIPSGTGLYCSGSSATVSGLCYPGNPHNQTTWTLPKGSLTLAPKSSQGSNQLTTSKTRQTAQGSLRTQPPLGAQPTRAVISSADQGSVSYGPTTYIAFLICGLILA